MGKHGNGNSLIIIVEVAKLISCLRADMKLVLVSPGSSCVWTVSEH